MRILALNFAAALMVLVAGAQMTPLAAPLTLAQALVLARANSPAFEAAVVAAGTARAATTQARSTLLPSLGLTSSYIYTQGNRYIANNGVHEYLNQGSVLETLGFGSAATLRRARAVEAVAAADQEIAARGLDATVTADYYTLVAAGHELATAQQALADAQKYLKISQELQRGGEVAHSDVIKAELEAETRQRGVREAQLAEQRARLALAVLLFPDFDDNYSVVDDLQLSPALPAFARVQALAHARNPDMAAAAAGLRQAQAGVDLARASLLPSLTLAYDYGIDAERFALRDQFRNPTLASSATATLNVPVFDWGARHAAVQQSDLARQEAELQLRYTRRQLEASLHSFYDEAAAAAGELTTLARSRQLAAESLRLSALRYQDGEATIVELVDAQTANTAARDAYDNGLVRYRSALAQLQTLTGPF
ncbi:MAG: TolC family protein [Terriglobales bacterium]